MLRDAAQSPVAALSLRDPVFKVGTNSAQHLAVLVPSIIQNVGQRGAASQNMMSHQPCTSRGFASGLQKNFSLRYAVTFGSYLRSDLGRKCGMLPRDAGRGQVPPRRQPGPSPGLRNGGTATASLLGQSLGEPSLLLHQEEVSAIYQAQSHPFSEESARGPTTNGRSKPISLSAGT